MQLKNELNKKVELKITPSYIKIYINDIIHLQLPYFKDIVMQSYKQGKNWYCISFANSKGEELTEAWYKDKAIWEEILRQWDENIY